MKSIPVNKSVETQAETSLVDGSIENIHVDLSFKLKDSSRNSSSCVAELRVDELPNNSDEISEQVSCDAEILDSNSPPPVLIMSLALTWILSQRCNSPSMLPSLKLSRTRIVHCGRLSGRCSVQS